jgi:predicted anti-sigma-YlaC factor YlaD
MRCEELRRRLAGDGGGGAVGGAGGDGGAAGVRRGGGPGGLDADAEAHLADCPACFAWVERADPLLRALREARPPAAVPSPGLAGRVLSSWQAAPRPLSAHPVLGLAAAGSLAAACAAAALLLASVVGSRLGDLLGHVTAGLGSLLAPLSALGGIVSTQLLERPGWLVGLVAVAVAAGWAWTRIDLRLWSGPRSTG